MNLFHCLLFCLLYGCCFSQQELDVTSELYQNIESESQSESDHGLNRRKRFDELVENEDTTQENVASVEQSNPLDTIYPSRQRYQRSIDDATKHEKRYRPRYRRFSGHPRNDRILSERAQRRVDFVKRSIEDKTGRPWSRQRRSYPSQSDSSDSLDREVSDDQPEPHQSRIRRSYQSRPRGLVRNRRYLDAWNERMRRRENRLRARRWNHVMPGYNSRRRSWAGEMPWRGRLRRSIEQRMRRASDDSTTDENIASQFQPAKRYRRSSFRSDSEDDDFRPRFHGKRSPSVISEEYHHRHPARSFQKRELRHNRPFGPRRFIRNRYMDDQANERPMITWSRPPERHRRSSDSSSETVDENANTSGVSFDADSSEFTDVN